MQLRLAGGFYVSKVDTDKFKEIKDHTKMAAEALWLPALNLDVNETMQA